MKLKMLKTSGIDDNDNDNGNQNSNGGGGNSSNGDNNDGINGESLRAFWMSVVGSGNFTFDKLEGNVDFVGGSVLKIRLVNGKIGLMKKLLIHNVGNLSFVNFYMFFAITTIIYV